MGPTLGDYSFIYEKIYRGEKREPRPHGMSLAACSLPLPLRTTHYELLSLPTPMSDEHPQPRQLTEEAQGILKSFRRRLIYLILLSSGIDALIFGLELPFIPATLGSSLIVDEIVEFLISSLIAKNRMKIKTRYKIAGFFPIPGLTALTLQCIVEYIQSHRAPEDVLARLDDPDDPLQVWKRPQLSVSADSQSDAEKG